MKCINKKNKLACCVLLSGILLSGCAAPKASVVPYEKENYNTNLYKGSLFASELCVAKDNLDLNSYQTDSTLHAAALFGVNQQRVYYSYNIHERLYPASTTKILTAIVALKYGNLSDIITVGPKATTELDPESSVAGLKEGDQITLEGLLNGLLLASGNDSAVAIAEHISGSEEDFVELMNQEARNMGATNTHFMNSHGLQDADHYTTAYDLYLMFNEAIKDERFLNIIEASSYSTSITGDDGIDREVTWSPTNFYAQGTAAPPGNVTIVGGKTGTTDEAGSCLILLSRDTQNNPYISIVMGGSTKTVLYDDMTALISALPAD